MGFSGGVKLGDLDDFISMSQECVKPLIEAAEGGGAQKLTAEGGTTKLGPVETVPQVQRPNLIKTKKSATDPKAQIGQVSLSDCLACSGCVTSAETVLLQEQSGEEFLKRAASSPLTVVSFSAAACVSLSAHFGTSPLEALRRATTALHRLGATYVLETSAAEAISLLEGKAQFTRRFKEGAASAPVPLLTSHCPGWTCYAEKVVDPMVLPHLAPLRPPQELQGRLVKTQLVEAHNRRRFLGAWRARSPLFAAECGWWLRSLLRDGKLESMAALVGSSDVYHVSVQPCYDKKLEAARPGFDMGGEVREVDTVLTTTEVVDLLKGAAGGVVHEAPQGATAEEAFAATPAVAMGNTVLTDLCLGDISIGRPEPLISPVRENGGSGGFLEYVFREAAAELFPEASSPSAGLPLEFKSKQNQDMREVVLEDPRTKRPLLKFVAAYGFRNIQNVIRRITRAGVDPAKECGHFVEIMACPGGCLNGGGQIPLPKTGGGGTARKADRDQRLSEMDSLLHQGEGTAFVAPSKHPLVLPLYRFMAARAAGSGAGAGAAALAEAPLDGLVGNAEVQRWLAADWRSLKVDSEGKAVVSSSVLKW